MTRNLSTQTAIILTSVITVNVSNVIYIVTSISIMDSSNIEDEEENINVSGRLAFDHSESVEGDKNLDDNVPTLSEHFNLNRSDKEENPIFETGKTWFSKAQSNLSPEGFIEPLLVKVMQTNLARMFGILHFKKG